MTRISRFVLTAFVVTSFVGCASLQEPKNPTVGDSQIVVDDNGNEVALPDSLPQAVYADEDRDYGIPLTTNLNTGPSVAPTPVAHPSAKVQFTPAAYSSFRDGNAIFVYVGDSYDPEGRAVVVPGSLWWPTAGDAAAGAQERLLEEIAVVTGGDASIPIVLYCDRPDCWGPYNAALQLQNSPYQNVVWYRGGTSAWYEAGLPLEIAFAPDWS